MVIPDNGDRVLIVESENNTARLSLIDLRGQATELVRDAAEVDGTLAPDGKRMAYWVRGDDERYTLTVADAAGANPIEVARDLRSVFARFSSDSSRLFFSRTDDDGSSFVVTNADGQNPIVLSRTGSGRGEVANGRLIYQVSDSGEHSLFTSDLNGDDRVEIARGADELFWRLTPDRRQIIVYQKRKDRYALQISDFKHEQAHDLKRSDDPIGWVMLDDRRVLVLRHANNYSSTTLSTIQSDGTDEQTLKRALQVYSIDTRGADIVVGGVENGHGTLYLLGGEEEVTLDDEADGYSQARITPDGRIIYTANYKSGPVTYSVGRDGKQKKLLVDGAAIVAAGF
jgi:hypothetical protein